MTQPHAPDLEKFLNDHLPKPRGIIYAASPYWHPDPQVRDARYQAVKQVTRILIKDDNVVFSPIVYTATIQDQQKHHPMGWYNFDLSFLDAADSFLILAIPGWMDSRGMLLELAYARARRIPISKMEWSNLRQHIDQDTAWLLENASPTR